MGIESFGAVGLELMEVLHCVVKVHVNVACSPSLKAAVYRMLFETMYQAASNSIWEARDGKLFNLDFPDPYKNWPIRSWDCHVTQIEDRGPRFVLRGFVIAYFENGEEHRFEEHTGIDMPKAKLDERYLH